MAGGDDVSSRKNSRKTLWEGWHPPLPFLVRLRVNSIGNDNLIYGDEVFCSKVRRAGIYRANRLLFKSRFFTAKRQAIS